MSKLEEMPNAETNNLSSILNQISQLDESAEDFEEKKQELLRQAATLTTDEQVEVLKEESEDEKIEGTEVIDKETLKTLTERVEGSALSPEAKDALVSDFNEILQRK